MIGRDLKKTLIIDNLAENFKFTTPDNGIHIEDFTGDMDDCELGRLGLFLERLVKNKEDDIRPSIHEYTNRRHSISSAVKK